uniref:Uncharacterized protein n=1 Tax=Nelumbo nucifera TaxID=4432 RepID=A0A822XNN4_NELNU|nr:TPA_asm: hypothetical protein HUJ06_020591 [Nelumbo nucifera]
MSIRMKCIPDNCGRCSLFFWISVFVTAVKDQLNLVHEWKRELQIFTNETSRFK